MGQPRDKMYEDLKLWGYRPKMMVEYLRWRRLFAAYHRRSHINDPQDPRAPWPVPTCPKTLGSFARLRRSSTLWDR